MTNDVHAAIRALLDGAGVPYRALHHEPTRTSEESARVRGEPLEIGGKALLVKIGETPAAAGVPLGPEAFKLFVLSAVRKLDSAALKARFGVKKIRFAEPAELHALTGLVPGSVPPFGPPILPFELFVDESIAANERIAFNAGSLEDSIILAVVDYLRIARPTVFQFSTAVT